MPPRFGLAIGTAIDHRYALVFDLVDFGVAGVFTFQRHNRDVQGSIRTAIDKDMPIDDVRQISTFEFAALQTAGVRLGPVHTWLAAGAGLAIGLFQSREVAYRPGESRTTGPVACGAAGVDIEFRDGVALGVRLDFSHRLVRRRFTPDKGEPLLVFGDHASFAANLLYRF